jgi:hypothetical protein
MTRDPHDVDAEAYNGVVGRALLRGIRLTESRFDMKPDALELDAKTWRKDIRGEVEEVFVDAESGRLAGTFLFEVVCRHRRKRLLSASARYLVSYQVAGPFDQDSAQLFVERVGRVVAYPYFRALVASLTSQAAVEMPPLPIISLAPRTVASGADLEELGPVKILAEAARPKPGLRLQKDPAE